MIQFIELKDAAVYSVQKREASKLGDIIFGVSDISGCSAIEDEKYKTIVSLKSGGLLLTATTYKEIKSRLITEEK